jgi:hypothetical protein
MQSEINISIGDKAPSQYFSNLLEQTENGTQFYGAIKEVEKLRENFLMHCIPDGMHEKDIEHYDEFLENRRKLMALKIRDYYWQL